MATTTDNSLDVLSELIKLNNDRADGFEKALKDLGEGDQDLKTLFEQYSQQSRKFSQELTAASAKVGGDAETSNTVSGTLHRAWIDVKSVFTGHDRKSILEECERGEDTIKKAYKEALANTNLTGDISSILGQQSTDLQAAHDKIKLLRDSQA
jgi:uncharacterized protein (TIGR02284 family)